MAKGKLITIAQLKSELQNYANDELVTLITDISKACPQAKEFLTVRFACEENIFEVLESYKQKVKNEFFPKRGFGKLNLRTAKKAISDFKKINPDKALLIDIMLFYVENCVEFTAEYGDINEAFYISAESMFEQVVKAVNSAGQPLYEQFADRLLWVVENACEGWAFKDSLMDLYCDLKWLDDLDT